MTISAAQMRAARGLVGWSQGDLANAAKVSRATIADFESGKREPYRRTLEDLRIALESAGVIFLDKNGEGAGVRMQKSWAFEGVDQIAGHLGITQNEAEMLCTSQELHAFKPDGALSKWLVSRDAMNEFVAQRRPPMHPKPAGPATDAVEAMDAAIEEHQGLRPKP